MYKVGDTVIAKIARCQCVGGGFTEVHGLLIGFIPDNQGGWWQVSTNTGVQYVREQNLVSPIISTSA